MVTMDQALWTASDVEFDAEQDERIRMAGSEETSRIQDYFGVSSPGIDKFYSNSSDNPVECSCSNRWLYTLQPNTIRTDRVALDLYLQLPTMIQLNEYNYKQACNVSCPAEEIQLQV